MLIISSHCVIIDNERGDILSVPVLPVIMLLLGLTGMLGSLTWILRRGNRNRVTHLFMICQFAIVLWLISQLLILFSESRKQLLISYFIGNVGISIFSPFWLMFSAEYAEVSKSTRKLTDLMPLVSLSAILIILTDRFHRLYYAEIDIGTLCYGPAFYVFQVIYYLCIITGITMMCVKSFREHNQITKQTILLTLSTAVPMMINTLTVTRIIDLGVELTPLFFAFSSIMILIAISRYGLLNINRIAIKDAVNNIQSAVYIFDQGGNLTYRNRISADFWPNSNVKTLKEFISGISEHSKSAPTEDFSSVEAEYSGRSYIIRQSYVNDKYGNTVARVIVSNDVTEYYELARTEKKLSIEKERNRIAQEIHDSAGHTFTMISSIAKILQSKGIREDEAAAYLKEIDGLSRSGVTQLRCSINNLRDDEFMTSVTAAVKSVLGAVRGIETDLCIQGNEDDRYAFCIREVYDNCRETITNAMRYSGADRIDVIIKFQPENLELFILDNGKGCAAINENNGLRGIRERTESLGGTVRFTSVDGEGFTTIIKIPVKG